MSEQTSPGAHPGDGNPETPKLPPRISVKQTLGRVEGGEVTAVKIGQFIVYLPPLSWLVPIAILVPALVVAAILLYPQFTGPGRMNHDFNIAIAEFGQMNEQGQVVPSPVGAQLGDSIFNRLSAEIEAIPRLKGTVEVRHQRIGLLKDADDARRLADRLNAHLVVYGTLEVSGTEKTLLPKFFVRELAGADELVGPSELGRPVPFRGSPKTADTIQARSQVLTSFAIGLSYWVAGDYDEALSQFEQAAIQENSADTAGKEVLYLFLGTAYKSRAVATKNTDDLKAARAAYTAALGINNAYARAYIGLGNTYYEEYRIQYNRDHEHTDRSKLDLAATEYISATRATDRAPTANIDAKVNFSLGNLYLAQAQAGETGRFADAGKQFEQVITEYKRDTCNTQLQAIAARAYCGLGIVNERGTKDDAAAYDFYQRCRDNAADDNELLSFAPTRQADIRGRLRQSGAHVSTASATPAPACASQPTAWPCGRGLFGLGIVLVALSQLPRIRRISQAPFPSARGGKLCYRKRFSLAYWHLRSWYSALPVNRLLPRYHRQRPRLQTR